MLRRLFSLFLILALAGLGASPALAQPGLQTAVFAGGCFWSMQHDLKPIPGVVRTVVGYTGGHVDHPSYEQVSSETTGHLEAVQVTFDPAKLSYAALVEHYWRRIDPTDAGGAFCDRGASYHSAIFFNSPEQQRIAQASRDALNSGRFKGRVVTEIRPAAPFWRAEDYHQDFAAKNPVYYGQYRTGCGKDASLREIWGVEALR